ncbi:MAG: hypothetical protein EPN85_14590 [Bacteroidetes bacterium]|nr:MAG: hypothetical protein EPN85_14590 [Bacteroidota bacterium]
METTSNVIQKLPPFVTDFNSPFILKGKILQIKIGGQPIEKPVPRQFKSEKELSELVMENGKVLFGDHIMMIDGKKTVTVFETGYNASAFLVDFKNLDKPKLYIVETVLSKGNFSGLFFRMTVIFTFLRNQDNRIKLADTVAEYMNKNKTLRKELNGDADKIIEALRESIKRKPYILLVNDSEIEELAGFRETYTDTWGETLKPVIIRKFSSSGETIITMLPDFDTIRSNGKKKTEKSQYTEEDHFEYASEDVKAVYGKIKAELLKKDKTLQFNAQKYYISMRKNRNLAFFHVGQKKISLVVMNSDKDTRKQIKHHEVKTLTEKVQKFWNGASCTIVLANSKHLNEVIFLLKKLVANA